MKYALMIFRTGCVLLAAAGLASLPAQTRTASEAASPVTDAGLRRIVIRLMDAETDAPLAGIVRITRTDNGEQLRLTELVPRNNGWYTMPPLAELGVPAVPLTIEALRGLQTELARTDVDSTTQPDQTVTLRLRRFRDEKQRGWRNANTHLHLMKRSRIEADRYLREVPDSDGLELVYLSHLRRIPDETTYISNEIVEQGLTGDALERLSYGNVIIRPGEEHRHNFGRGGEGFGHVMLLDITKLIRPVSIGPGIMRSGSDGIPLQRGIRTAHSDGATVVWCHNALGFEDIPSWVGGDLDAQNIFDGGNQGSYEDSFYRYLNLGMRIPFSTGTDWFIDDFSRVYVPLDGKLTSEAWLKQLRAGRSFITNGPLLEFTVDGHAIGDTLDVSEPTDVQVNARAVGRTDFRALELIRNGEVIARATTRKVAGHHEAALDESVLLADAGWLAVRTPVEAATNAFGQPIYAHTSPIYVDFEGRRSFDPTVALELIGEIEESLQAIRVQAVFANDSEHDTIMNVYREGIRVLKRRIAEQSR